MEPRNAHSRGGGRVGGEGLGHTWTKVSCLQLLRGGGCSKATPPIQLTSIFHVSSFPVLLLIPGDCLPISQIVQGLCYTQGFI